MSSARQLNRLAKWASTSMEENLDVLALLDFYGVLRNPSVSGEWQIKVLCPFHADKNPSMQVSLRTGVFYCFACGEHGNLVDLIARLSGINTLQAMQKIVSLTKDPNLLVRQNEDRETEDPYRDVKRYRKEAYIFFSSLPKPSWAIIKRHYLNKRGYRADTLVNWDVRINPASNYSVIIPIIDQGRFYGYISRRTDGEEPKYLYSKGLPKRSILAGNIRPGTVLVVEGILDAMMAYQNGYKNTCALLGWKCSKWQVRKLQKYASKVICGTDNDEAGERGYRELCRVLDVQVIRFPFVPGYKDIGEMPKNVFRSIILSLRDKHASTDIE